MSHPSLIRRMGSTQAESQDNVHNTVLAPHYPLKKKQLVFSAGEGIEKRELSYIVGGNVNWYSHYGEQYGGSL